MRSAEHRRDGRLRTWVGGKASLDVFWLRDEDLEAALAQFAEVAETISTPPGVTSEPA